MYGHPGGNTGANLKSTSHKCYLLEVAFQWELTKKNIYLPLGCLQGGAGCRVWGVGFRVQGLARCLVWGLGVRV